MPEQNFSNAPPPVAIPPLARSRPFGGNRDIAGKLREFGDLLNEQGADGFRCRAYWRAADIIDALDRSVEKILSDEGLEGLTALPGVGVSIAGAIAELLRTGRWSQLERLRGEVTPEILFQSIPGIGPQLAQRLAADGRLDSLEDLENALHAGDLAVKGIGPRRRQMIASILSERLARLPSARRLVSAPPPVELLLQVDRMYRERAAAGLLRKIAPRRFNPGGEAWLPIMHASHDDWRFTVLFSNTRLAHELGKTTDWVVIYHQKEGQPEGRSTVVTATRGPNAGRRTVRGREEETPSGMPTTGLPADES